MLDAQLLHAAPAAPHAVVSVPTEHALPFQQPVQQLPLKQRPPVHALRSATAGAEHAPAEQTGAWHCVAEQAWQKPPLPHCAVLCVVWHVFEPSRQPLLQQLPEPSQMPPPVQVAPGFGAHVAP